MVTEFTPLTSLAGGVLIGLSAAGLMLVSGRIAGITGIVRRFLMPDANSRPREAAAFLAGLVVAPVIYSWVTGLTVEQTVSSNGLLMVVAGMLVGFGSTIGSGCTSGHGICGLSRMSLRSLVATATFMSTAAATVYVFRHGLGVI